MTASLYRKYRPQTFADVVGQDAIERTLRNAIAQDKVSHAYLFCGPRGTGKTTTARIMAKALLCDQGPTPDPDGVCPECQAIADGIHPDVYELDAASRTGVENVREEIIGRVNFAPTRGRAKVYIIDEVHMLSTAAFNALLKTLEEPPDHVIFILCTTDPQKVPATICSRCQRFDFHRISRDEIVARLGSICVAEDVSFEAEALDLIAARSDGGMRNALTTLEQLIVFCEGSVSLEGAQSLLGSLDSSDMAEIIEAVGRRDAAACFHWTADYVDSGADLAQFVRDMADHIRDLYVLSVIGEDAPIDISESDRATYEQQLLYFTPDRLARLLDILGATINELRFSNNPRLAFEIALTRMIRPETDLTLESLAERVETLERALAGRSLADRARPLPEEAAHTLPPREEAPKAAATRVPYTSEPSSSAPVAASPVAPPTAASFAPEPPSPEAPTPLVSVAPASSPASAAPSPASAAPDATSPAAPAGTPTPPAAPTEPPAASAPASSSAAASSEAADGLMGKLANPAFLQTRWQEVLKLLKKEKAAYGIFFLNTEVTLSEEGDAIVVTFPEVAAFAYEAVMKPDLQRSLREAVRRVFGAEVPLRCVRSGSSSAASTSPAVASAPAPTTGGFAPTASAPAHPRTSPASVAAASPNASFTSEARIPASAPAPERPARSQAPEADYDAPPLQAYPEASGAFTAPEPSGSDPSSSPTSPASVPTSSSGQAFSGDINDIQELLSSSFGNEIIFEEIDEGDERP